MTLRDLEKHLRKANCVTKREGGGHSIWVNPANDKSASLPRHNEIAWGTVKAICDQLEIERPTSR
jgi:hypothetical protein